MMDERKNCTSVEVVDMLFLMIGMMIMAGYCPIERRAIHVEAVLQIRSELIRMLDEFQRKGA